MRRDRYLINELAGQIAPGGRVPTDDEVVQVAAASYEGFRSSWSEGLRTSFVWKVRHEVGARLWYARQLEALDLEPAPYLYLGAKLAQVDLTDCEVIDRQLGPEESPLAHHGPLIVLSLAGPSISVLDGVPWESESSAVFEIYGVPAVPCLVAPTVWLDVGPGTAISWAEFGDV
jgi:hypothetical protein